MNFSAFKMIMERNLELHRLIVFFKLINPEYKIFITTSGLDSNTNPWEIACALYY